MDLQSRKILFVQEFLSLQNEEIIKGLEEYLRAKRMEIFESQMTPKSMETFNKEIDQAISDSNSGRVTSAKELMQRTKTWR